MRTAVKRTVNTTYQQSRSVSTSPCKNYSRNFRVSATSLAGIVLAAFGISTLLQGLDGENDNLSAANFHSVYAEEDHSRPERILIACNVAEPSVAAPVTSALDEMKTILFPGASVVGAALSVSDSVECVDTVPPPTPSFQHCVHSDTESVIDQKDYSCSDDNMVEHKFLVTFGRYLSNNDFIE